MQIVTRTPTLQITLVVATCLIALEDYRFFFLYIVSQENEKVTLPGNSSSIDAFISLLMPLFAQSLRMR